MKTLEELVERVEGIADQSGGNALNILALYKFIEDNVGVTDVSLERKLKQEAADHD